MSTCQVCHQRSTVGGYAASICLVCLLRVPMEDWGEVFVCQICGEDSPECLHGPGICEVCYVAELREGYEPAPG